eukprot:TRINITY_DN26349_c0_g2_i1.p1 TRINITY_DN26349_c0_g2~~TRINITY_DN26349_c0_g2_i1.p1  ORF type:complete len:402 (+),score=34.03 TRINITY_DN26349_c0_g2_i1:23-1228(+)
MFDASPKSALISVFRGGTISATPLVEGNHYFTAHINDDQKRQLLKYDVKLLSSPRAMFVLSHTAFKSTLVLTAFGVSCVLAVVAGIVRAQWADEINYSTNALSDARTYVAGLATFMLGFYISIATSRWWDMRNACFGNLWGAIDDLALLLGAHFPEREASDMKTLVLRYGVLSVYLLFEQARGNCSDEDKQEEMFDWLFHKHLIKEQELRAIRHAPSKPQVVWCWIASLFHRLHVEKKLSSRMLCLFYTQCTRARGAIGACFAYLDTQLPYAYVHLLGTVVNLLIYINAVECGVKMSSAFAILRAGNADSATSREAVEMIAIRCLSLIIYPVFYTAFLVLAAELSNPFDKDFQNFPLEAYHKFMLDECRAFHTNGGVVLDDVVAAVSKIQATDVDDRVKAS